MDYQSINAQAIDRWVETGWEWGIPITHQQYADALEGRWGPAFDPPPNRSLTTGSATCGAKRCWALPAAEASRSPF